jgi:hypothetical protein
VNRVLGFVATAFTVALVCAGVASASTTVAWSATFSEPMAGSHSCAPGTSCGSGEVVGLGQAQDVIVFNACGSGCDDRTLTFQDGSTLVMDEHGSNFREFGQGMFRLDLSDLIVGDSSTGRFAGANGSATGQVTVAFRGGQAVVTLSGTVTF